MSWPSAQRLRTGCGSIALLSGVPDKRKQNLWLRQQATWGKKGQTGVLESKGWAESKNQMTMDLQTGNLP